MEFKSVGKELNRKGNTTIGNLNSRDIDRYIYVLNHFLSDKIQQQRIAKGIKITPTTRYNKRRKRTQQQPENETKLNIYLEIII